VIPELLNGTSHGFPKRANNVLHVHKLLVDRASKERHAVDALNSSVFGPTRLFCQKLLMHTQNNSGDDSRRIDCADCAGCCSCRARRPRRRLLPRDRQRSLQRFQALPSGGLLLRSGTDLSQVFPNVHQASKPFVLALVKDATNLIAQWRFDLTTLVTGKRPHAVRPAFDSAERDQDGRRSRFTGFPDRRRHSRS